MDAYTGFAYVYDEYMDNIPYEEWGQYMIALLKENGVSGDSSVLELGCGTGTVTRMLAKEGYDCVGLDMSEDMLSIASEKTFEEGSQVIYTCKELGLHLLPGKEVKVPRLAESPVNIECRVTEVKELGSHDMFLAEVVAVSVDDAYMDEKNSFHLDQADPIVYSHGTYYAMGKELGRFGYSVRKKS